MYKLFLLFTICFTLPIFAQQADPTRPFSMKNSSASSAIMKTNQLILQSIVGESEQKNVVISGKVLKLGDTIGEYTLHQINDNDVVLKSSEKTVTLSLFSDVVAKTK